MTLFPPLDDAYYVDNDHNLLKMMDYNYAKNITINQSYWSEADVDSRFVAGDQTLWNDIYGNLPAFRRRQFNFNRIRRVINMITGYQRQHRKSTVCLSLEDSSNQTADQFTKCLLHAYNNDNTLLTISDAFEGACKTGMNLLSVWMDYRNDPVNGELRVDNCAYNSFLIDPYFRKMDLSDCQTIWSRKYITREQAKVLIPGRGDEVSSLKGWGARDGKFQFMPEAYNYGMQDLLVYDEFWYQTTRKQRMLVDVETGESVEWRGNEEDLNEFLRMYKSVDYFDYEIPTVNLGIVVQGKVFYHGPNPMGIDHYPFVPVMAYYDPNIPYFPWRIQGVARGLRDAQYLYNRRRVIELDILEAQMSSGFIYKENALVNPKDVFLQGQGKGLALKANANPQTDVVPIQAPSIPPSMIQLSELLAKEVQEISGVNEELLGMADDDKAGVLAMLRQGAGLTTLQVLFDNLDYAQKLLGKLQIKLIQQNWTPGKVARIIKEEPTPEFYSRAFGKYDAVVEEGLNTSIQKQIEFRQLLELRQLDIPVPVELLIKTSTLTGKNELIQALQGAEQQQQQTGQMEAMANLELLQAKIESLKGKSAADQGLFLERASRIEENSALATERRAEAQRNRDQGTLDRIKAAKELTGMDIDQLEKLVNLVRSLQEQETSDESTFNSQERLQEKVNNVQGVSSKPKAKRERKMPRQPGV